MTAAPDTATPGGPEAPGSRWHGRELPPRRVVVGDWSRLAIATVARVVLLVLVGALFWAEAPALIGWKPTTVMSNSMAPRFFAGDVIVAMPATADNVQLGRIVLVDDPDHLGRLRLHRFVGTDASGDLITKGDANASADSSHLTRAHVRGVAVLRVPVVGLPFVWAAEHRWMLLVAGGIGIAGLFALTGVDAHLRRRRIDPGDRGAGTGAGDDTGGTAGVAASRARLVVGGVAAATVPILLLSAGMLGTGSYSAYSATTANPASALTTQPTSGDWCSQTAVLDNPYFYYRFSESAGTSAVDASGNGRTATLGSTVTRTGGSCTTSPSPYVTLPGNTSTGTITAPGAAMAAPTVFSVEAWFKTSSNSEKIIGFGSSASGASLNYDRHLYVDVNGKLVFAVFYAGYQTVTSPAAVNNNAWHHVIATIDSTGMKLWLDGVNVSSNSNTQTTSNTGYWRIGYDNLLGWPGIVTTLPYSGALDDVAVYSTGLSASQVAAHYALGH